MQKTDVVDLVQKTIRCNKEAKSVDSLYHQMVFGTKDFSTEAKSLDSSVFGYLELNLCLLIGIVFQFASADLETLHTNHISNLFFKCDLCGKFSFCDLIPIQVRFNV